MLTGGFSEVNRAQRVAMAQAEFRAELAAKFKDLPGARSTPISSAFIRPTGSRSICRTSSLMPRFVRETEAAGKSLATSVGFDAARGVTELTVFAPDPSLAAVDHRRRLRARRRQYRRRPDLHHDRRARARHHLGVARIRARRGRRPPRRAHRRRHREGAARRAQTARRRGRSARRPKAGSRPSPSSPKSPSITNGRAVIPWSKSPASTGRACSMS